MTLLANPDAVPELRADGRLIRMTPTGSEIGARNSALLFQLRCFAGTSGSWQVVDSSSGFQRPDGSVLSADASLCPDLVVEPWPAGGAPQRLERATVLDGGAEVPGLTLHWPGIWAV